ncbi:endo-beta-1:4-glucanase D [Diplocarpon mali]|nr:endo-beta-1:4-glucanase D [Diplocarpon mali]
MKYSQVLAGAAAFGLAQAHTTIYSIAVNDVDQGLGNTQGGYIRFPPNNNPVKDVTSKDMTCNVNNVPAAKTIDVAAGDKITLQWHHDSNQPSDDIIASSHKGPVQAYIAPTASEGAGDVWVKLKEDGYSGGKWGVENLIAAKGKFDVTLPAGLAQGPYLLRGEIIALHEGEVSYQTNPGRGAQFYMGCVQLNVGGSGSTALPAGVAIPGAYAPNDPGVVFNIYGGAITDYPIPGPAVWDGASGGGAAPPATTPGAAPPATTPGAAPPATYPSGDTPSTTSAAGKPATTPAGGKPATTPPGYKPATTPGGEEPATYPSGDKPATTPAGGKPATTPPGYQPATTPGGEKPATKPATSSKPKSACKPKTTAGGSGPATTPAGNKPATTPGAAPPATYPSGDKPATTPAGGKPATTPPAYKPATTPGGEEPATYPSGDKPATTPAGGKPATTPAGGKPATTPAGEKPATYPAGEKPATTLATSTRPKSACKPKTTAGGSGPATTPAGNKPATTPPAYRPATTPGTARPSGVPLPSGVPPTGNNNYPTDGGATVPKYGQCGGSNYKGSTTCADGSTCTSFNDYYSQCV